MRERIAAAVSSPCLYRLALGLRHVVVAVNKMDLVGYDHDVFAAIEADFRAFLASFQTLEPFFIPISALAGDNIREAEQQHALVHWKHSAGDLETVPLGENRQQAAFRFPVQRVVRPHLNFRGYAGTVVAGSLRTGDSVVVYPSGRKTTVENITTFDGNLLSVHAGQAVTLTLTDEVDISRGDVITSMEQPPQLASNIDATVVWLSDTPGEVGKRYRLKQAARLESAELRRIYHRVNINTLEREPAQALEMNSVGQVRMVAARPLAVDNYVQNRVTGSFILIDPVTNATVAAGMITGSDVGEPTANPRRAETPVSLHERIARQRHSGAVIRLGQNRLELALRLERLLFDEGCVVFTFEDLKDEAIHKLLTMGALVILTSGPQAGYVVETAQGKKQAATESLPDDNTQAAAGLQSLLQNMQVLSPAPTFTDSDGI